MKSIITLTLLIFSLACFGQANESFVEAKAQGIDRNMKTITTYGPVQGLDLSKGKITLPADVQKKLVSLDSVIQVVSKQYREIVEPLQAQQEIIFDLAFSFNGISNWKEKVDSVRYNKGTITYKVKPK